MIFKYTNLQFAQDYSFKWYSAWHLNYAPICFMNSNQIFKLLRNDLVIRTNIIRIIEYVYRYISDYDEGWVFQISFNQMWVFKYCFCTVYMTIISAVNNHPFLPLHLEGGGKIHWAKFWKKVQYFGENWAIDNNVLFHFNL